ncbi:hypothetical protein PVL29_002466 [Vitis rotundifolia]|uniref:Ubiquitin-like protease family profile domain-containing protein n=1 Tax=Vitis rotundifolia TaxID=103349 RepID=A0AA39AHR7_VITRO|nr:hypothetical protein PVL29_002466 [Vitis rotundifolia]
MAKSKKSSKQYSLQKCVGPKEKYTALKGLFLGSREKPLRELEEGTKSDSLLCERSLEEKDNKKENEHYVDTLLVDKLCTKDMNGKNEDACATSIEMHIIPNENADILPLLIKRIRKDYGKEPLQALCGIVEHIMRTHTSRERKPSKFKVSLFVHNLRKMGKRKVSEIEFCQTFFKLYNIRKNVFQFSIDWAPPILTQDNGWDCGVHVIKHMQTFQNGDCIKASDLRNSVKIHQEIASDLVLHKRNREKQTILAIVCTNISTRAMRRLLL